MYHADKLREALTLLGQVLEGRNLAYDIAVIGGAAMLLQNLSPRPTEDCDAVALVLDEDWSCAKPLPEPLVQAVHEVAVALDLVRTPRDEKDWLNSGPAFLFQMGLPDGFEQRVALERYGPLTVRIAARPDLITLKLWAATSSSRLARLQVDLADLRELNPSPAEWRDAIAWCLRKDGRAEFFEMDIVPILTGLGVDLKTVRP